MTALLLYSSREQLGHHNKLHTNYATMEEIQMVEQVLVGTFFLNECPIIILFDSSVSHNFMSYACAKWARLALVASGAPYVISTLEGRVHADRIA
jgi:hypothetical protein